MDLNEPKGPVENSSTSYKLGSTLTPGIIALNYVKKDKENFISSKKINDWSGLPQLSKSESSIGNVVDLRTDDIKLDPIVETTSITTTKEEKVEKLENNKNQNFTPEENKNSKKISNHNLADFLMGNHKFAVINNNLHCWIPVLGYFIGLVGDKADTFIRQNIPDRYKSLINLKSSEEITRWLMSKEQFQVSEEKLQKRKKYVAFSNCVLKISNLSIHPHSPKYYFTSILNTEYPLDTISSGDYFESFIQWITGGNLQIYLRLQELFGYILSEIRDVKVIPFLLGPKDSGKSIVLKLLVNMIGEEFSTNLSFDEMNKPEYLCHLFGKKLNACAEISELPLNRLDNLKKLSGGDYIMARMLYAQAIKFINPAVLLFSGNHLPTTKGIDRSNAFSERLEIFPFSFQVPKADQDINLLDKLLKEKPYIAKWSITGMNRWIKNNHQFTSCKKIEEMEQEYVNNNNSIKSFLNTYCILSPNIRTHNVVLIEAYHQFCIENDFVTNSEKVFHKYMQQVKGLIHTRFRESSKNENGYIGIGLQDGWKNL